MKNMLIILLTVFTVGCVMQGEMALKSYTTKDYHLDGIFVTKGNDGVGYDTLARMTAFEIAYDNGIIVYEATFKLLDNDTKHAGNIIKTVHESKPDWDVEVELDYENFFK